MSFIDRRLRYSTATAARLNKPPKTIDCFGHLPTPPASDLLPLLGAFPQILIDQTVWSATWNGTYYGLLGVLRREPPAVIAASVRASCLDLMVAGWKLWPLAHLVTYGLIPREHR